jgi:TonB family protein
MQRTTQWISVLALALAMVLQVSAETVLRCTHREMPNYPMLLRSLRIGGHVKLRLTVAPNGKVTTAKLQGGNPVLGELSCVAAKKWIYATSSTGGDVAVELLFEPTTDQPKVVE